MNARPWLVTWQNVRGRILKRRFYSETDAVMYREVELMGVHPSRVTVEYRP